MHNLLSFVMRTAVAARLISSLAVANHAAAYRAINTASRLRITLQQQRHNMSSDSSMNTVIINGTLTAKNIRQQLAVEVSTLVAASAAVPVPTLAVVLVGSRKDSQAYVNMKTKACNECGIHPIQHDLPETTSQADLIALIEQLNADVTVNGILVQLPLPSHMDQDTVIQHIDARKDVDGLTLASAGNIYSYGLHTPLFVACTPLGCIELLDSYKIEISGKHAVVLGRSALVGKPIASLLLSRHATVTVCHSKTSVAQMTALLQSADIVIAAIGKPLFVKAHMLKAGAVVIDVGINAVSDATDKRGYKLVGDVDYDACAPVCSAITPVPGGVGPMTVAMLLRNTVKAHAIQQKKQ